MIKKVCKLLLGLAMVVTMIGTAMAGTIYTNDGAGGVKENRLNFGMPNWVGNDGLRLGFAGIGVSEGPHRMLLKFDLSVAAIPSADHVASATVNFNNHGPWLARSMTIDIHKVTKAWDPDRTTWNTQPTFEAIPTVSITQPWGNWGAAWDHTIDVTNLVKGWVSDPSSNHGMLIKQHDETVAQDIWGIISSRLSSTNSLYPTRPGLVVTLLSDTQVLFGIVGNLETRVEAIEDTLDDLVTLDDVNNLIDESLAPVSEDIDTIIKAYNLHTHDKGSGSRNTSAPVPQIQ